MKSWIAPTVLFLFCLAPTSYTETPKPDREAAAKAALIESARDEIIWHDQERKAPLLLPEAVLTKVALVDLPVPSTVRDSITMWISFVRDWRSPATGMPYPECTSARRPYSKTPVPEEEQTTLEETVEEVAVSIFVVVDKVTKGYWPDEGIYQYNEYTVLKVLKGADFRNNPMKGGAFLSDGGEIVIDGTRLCTLPSVYQEQPRPGETYLLIGAPGENGIFHEHYYFRVTNGQIDWFDYRSLRKPATPPRIDELAAHLLAKGKSK